MNNFLIIQLILSTITLFLTVWVIVEILAYQPNLTVWGKIKWILMALFFNWLTAIVYASMRETLKHG